MYVMYQPERVMGYLLFNIHYVANFPQNKIMF